MNDLKQIRIPIAKDQRTIIDTLICSAGIIVFAYFITFPFPSKMIAFMPLTLSAFIISQYIDSYISHFKDTFHDIFSVKTLPYNVLGILLAITAGMYYRGSFGIPILPDVIRPFALVSVSIGIMEELVFRGFIQSQISKVNVTLAILFTSFTHASYKTCLFLSPTAIQREDILVFFAGSFVAFVVLGTFKHYSKSLLPVIIIHALFDLITYSDFLHAPWWVW